MNDLYIHQLEIENKQLKKRIKLLEDYGEAVGEVRNKLYDKINKAIEYIKDRFDGEVFTHTFDKCNMKELLEILGDKENE